MPKQLTRLTHCLNCGSETSGNFCSNCGQENEDQSAALKPLLSDLMADLAQHPDRRVPVDLETPTIVAGNRTISFTIDPVRRTRLLNGWDDIALTLLREDKIAEYERTRERQGPSTLSLG